MTKVVFEAGNMQDILRSTPCSGRIGYAKVTLSSVSEDLSFKQVNYVHV